MTARASARMRGGFKAAITAVLPILWLVGLLFFSVFLSGEAAGYTLEGMYTAVRAVLPTAIPSMLICDLYRVYGAPERILPLSRLFSIIFGISPAGLRAYLLGNLCGFPMGAREVSAAYNAGSLTKSEAERLIPLSSNPSPPFIVGAVGASMLGEWRAGVLLLICTALSSAACGMIFRKKVNNFEFYGIVSEQKYSFVESVKGAAESSLTIIAFITSFSVLLGFAKRYVKVEWVRTVIFALLEVTGGVDYFSNFISLPLAARGTLIAFTLGFGGISVLMQSAAFLKGTGLSLKNYLPVKLVQAVISALLFFAICTAFGW